MPNTETIVAYHIVEMGYIVCPECALDEQDYIIEIGRYDKYSQPEDFKADEHGILIGYHRIRPGELDFKPLSQEDIDIMYDDEDDEWVCGE